MSQPSHPPDFSRKEIQRRARLARLQYQSRGLQAEVHYKFDCPHCGERVMLKEADTLPERGQCNRCKNWSRIERAGFALHVRDPHGRKLDVNKVASLAPAPGMRVFGFNNADTTVEQIIDDIARGVVQDHIGRPRRDVDMSAGGGTTKGSHVKEDPQQCEGHSDKEGRDAD